MSELHSPSGLIETDLVPFSHSAPPGRRVLVLAPHPDDETLGCGGTLRLLSETGAHIRIVFLSGGEKADPAVSDAGAYSETRKKEAREALGILGIPDHAFLGFPDRELHDNRNELRDMLKEIIAGFRPDAVYGPSPIDLNPDHRVTAGLLLDIFRGSPEFRCLLYEVTTPLRPNLLVDITKSYGSKERAIRCYRSQLKITDYLGLITSLNRFRSLTLGSGVRFAEAFWEIRESTDGGEEEVRRWLTYKDKLL